MQKTVLNILIILAFALSACGTASPASISQAAAGATQAPATTQANSSGQTTNASGQGTNSTSALSTEMQLLVGIFKLEGTSNAVTADQAKLLLPLWKQIQSLNPSMGPGQGNPPQRGQGNGSLNQTSATPTAQPTNADTQSQIDALVKQVQAAMTADQLQAITAMNLTQASAMSILQGQGMNIGGAGGGGGAGQQPPQGNPPSGGNAQGPQGTPPAVNGQGGQVNPPSGNSQQPAQGTPQAGMAQGNPPAGMPTQSNFIPPQLINALLQLLQNRISGTTSQSNNTNQAAAQNGTPANNPNGGGSAGNANGTSGLSTASAAFTLDGKSDSQSGQTYTADKTDESAVYVSNAGALTLTNATIQTTGNSSSNDNSSFYGLNAGVLVTSHSTLNMSNSQVTTSGSGANGVFSSGSGTTVTLANGSISASGDGGHAVMATQGGTLTISNVDMATTGASASAIATDRGGGSINVTGGTVRTSGMNSAGIYSTGNITIANTTFISSGAEAAVIEGGNSITLKDASLSSSKAGKWGVMIYQSMSGDAEGTRGTFSMTGGSLAYTATDGPLFYVTNSTAVILLKGANLTAASGILLKAAAGNWGNNGSNGGTVLLTADGQALNGNLTADATSTITLTLQNGSSLTSAINPDKTAKAANLSLDAGSTWTLSGDSTLAGFSDAGGISGTTITNITGNGHTIFYDASLAANSSLMGKTYSLANGGELTPIN